MKKTLPLFLLIIVFTVNACAPLAAATPVVAAPSQNPTMDEKTPNLSLEILRSGVYNSPNWGEFQLSNGVYYRTPPTSQDSPEAYTTRLLDTVIYGDINVDGSEDALVFLNTQNGGTGHFIEMAAVLNLSGSAFNISTLDLGDRVAVESGTIQDGAVTLNLRVHGPNDPACCPSQLATWNYHFDGTQLAQVSSTDPVIADPIPSTQVSSWSIYNDKKYGYSIGYPDFYNVVIVNDEYVEIGDKIVVTVSNTDPSTILGDGPAIDSATDVQVGVYPAKLLTGYIGAVGGYIPQQIRRFVFERNGYYFVVTLYALGLHVTEGEISQIAQLNPEDVSLFDNIVASLQFP